MPALHMRCTGQCEKGRGYLHSCRLNVLVMHGEAPVLPGRMGAPVPSPAREQLLGHWPLLCPQANPDRCRLSVITDSELDQAVALLYHAFRESTEALKTRDWLDCAIRTPEGLPGHVRAAISSFPGALGALDFVAKRGRELTDVMTAHPLN